MRTNRKYVILIFLHVYSINVKSEDEKRFLENNPGTVESRLQQLEAQMNRDKILLQNLESKVTAIESDNAKLKRENENLINRVSFLEGNNQSSIVTYVRWGRTTCVSDPNTELLYDGLTGGSMHSDSGSGVNALCLPHNPDNGINISNLTAWGGGSLYGAEYQFTYNNIRSDDGVPCAVCLVKNATSVLMMPAKSSCPPGWNTGYTGVLTANYDTFQKSEFTCVDDDAEYINGTRSNDYDSKLFYPVKTVCGALPCPPYTSGAYVECAVCTI